MNKAEPVLSTLLVMKALALRFYCMVCSMQEGLEGKRVGGGGNDVITVSQKKL